MAAKIKLPGPYIINTHCYDTQRINDSNKTTMATMGTTSSKATETAESVLYNKI